MPSLRALLLLVPLLAACSSSPASPGTSTGGAGASASAGATAASGSGGAGLAGGGSAGASVASAGSGGVNADPSTSGGSSGANMSIAGSSAAAGAGASVACGYKNQGHVLNVSADISLCIPPQICLPETCPPSVGTCVNDRCVYKDGYQGLATLPEAWATHYCDLEAGTCQGVHQFAPVLDTARALASKNALTLCGASAASAKCVGIVASPPMMIGNREKYKENWGLGLSEASGLCYEVTGPGGSALLAITDRCGGYCKCPASGADEYNECGLCKEAPDLTPLCQCRGPGSCGAGQLCDWCAANNHPHFDLDEDAFNHVCGGEAFKGSCQLSKARFVPCLEPRADWPPPL